MLVNRTKSLVLALFPEINPVAIHIMMAFFYIKYTYTCYYIYINYLSELLVNVDVFNVTRPSCQLVEFYMDAK